jgi:hypothetical protein
VEFTDWPVRPGHSEQLFAMSNSAEVEARLRVARVIREYDAQGIHRTATAVDEASAHWLANQLEAIGVEAKLESFPIHRIDLDETFLDSDTPPIRRPSIGERALIRQLLYHCN